MVWHYCRGTWNSGCRLWHNTFGNMEICAVCQENPPLIPHVAAPKPPADTYSSFKKSKMFLQRCCFKCVCRAPDKTHPVASQRTGTVKAALLFYFVMKTERIIKNNSQNLSLPSKSVSSWSRFPRKHKPVGRSTSCSSFLTSPRLFGVDVAKEMKPVKLIHSIPLWSEGNTWNISAKIFELLEAWSIFFHIYP